MSDEEVIWNRIKDLFLDYSTNNSGDAGFRDYVSGQSQYLLTHAEVLEHGCRFMNI